MPATDSEPGVHHLELRVGSASAAACGGPVWPAGRGVGPEGGEQCERGSVRAFAYSAQVGAFPLPFLYLSSFDTRGEFMPRTSSMISSLQSFTPR